MEITYGNITSNSQMSGSASNINKNVNISTQGDLSGLKEGNVFKGEVLDIKGSQVTIGLENGQTVTAKLESDVPINIGQTLMFQVKSKDASQIQIRPVADFIGEQAIIQKALLEAGIPRDERTLAMINNMLKEGMSIDKQSLNNILRQLKTFNEASPETIVKMNKLGILVNKENIEQFENYKNYEHRLVKSIDTTAGRLSNSVLELVGEEVGKGIELNNKIVDILNHIFKVEEGTTLDNKVLSQNIENINIPIESGTEQDKGDSLSIAKDPMVNPENAENLDRTVLLKNNTVVENAVIENSNKQIINQDSAITDKIVNKAETAIENIFRGELKPDEAAILTERGPSEGIQIDEEGNPINGKAWDTSKELVGYALNKEARTILADKLTDMGLDKDTVLQIKSGEIENKELLNIVKELLKNPDNIEKAESLLGSREYREVLLNAIKHEWLIKPDNLKENDKVTQLYNQLEEQTKQLQSVLESMGKENTSSFKELGNMRNNLNFMNQLNQEYTYLQIPVQFTNEEAHGDLYVYTNKKNLRERKGELSVLLHLDMEILGTTDIYITMQGNKVSAKFTLDNNRSIEIIEDNVDMLIKQLRKSGYDALVSVDKLEKETDFVDDFLEKDKPVTSLKRYMFDVRA